MTIDELIARLEEYRDELGGETEIRLMTQQNWPFEYDLAGLASGQEINDQADRDEAVDADQVVFIVEGQQRCYGSKRAWQVASYKPKRTIARASRRVVPAA